MWLIDVESQCLKSAEQTNRYLALSYVWESSSTGHRPFETLKSNLHDLQQRGALAREGNINHIPKTILHTMGLTKLLGERYLWVDRFCIVQDDIRVKEKLKIFNMKSI